MAHEVSVTIKIDDGLWVNAPSKDKQGKRYTERQIKNMLINNTWKATSVHKSLTSAVKAAKKRSNIYKK
jgi:hypothetical protein|tara:strand:- start:492 stop:698 length:207 start_codon:yes stop_codon:yes gene_type:complete